MPNNEQEESLNNLPQTGIGKSVNKVITIAIIKTIRL
jgi:hypothetical protein